MKTPLLPTLLAVTTTLSAQPTKPQVIERGPHHKTWQWEITVTGPDGQTETQTHGYVEVGSGLCRWDGKEWVDGSEVIEVFPGGAIGRSAQMQAIFAPNLNTFGAIDTLAPDGNRIRSHLLGLAFYDLAAQESVMIAEVKDCVGAVLPPNQVIYRDAFDGQVLADVIYTYRLGSFQQDVILRAQLPMTPEDFGLSSDTTVLEVWTEMVSGREPQKVSQPAVATLQSLKNPTAPAAEMTDEDLDFGATRLVAGRAFRTDGRAEANPFPEDALPVAKNWVTVDVGRKCLVEQVAYGALRDQVARALPQARVTPPMQRAAVQPRRTFPAAPQHAQANRPAQPMQLAGLTPRPGFTIDYEQVVTTTNMTFKGDTTYLVMSTVNLSGTTTIEGGSVLKHTNGNNSVYLYVVSGDLQCKTTPWLPAILTSIHDDTVGEVLPGSTNTPSLTSGATRLRSVGINTVHDLRFRYADYGYVCTPTTGRVGFTNVQFFRCRYPLYLSGGRYDVHNLLLTDCEYGVYNTSTTNSMVNIEHGTFDRVNKLVGGIIVHLNLTNCLLTAVSNQAYFVGESNAFQSNGAGVFQTVGGGEHYLAENSSYRDAGTTNISAGMQSVLKNLTTFPPVLLSNSINADTVLSPQAGRDTDLPDLGYHYCPVDYMASNVTLRSVLTLSGGVAIGIGGDPGFDCAPNARISSRGNPLALNRLVGYQNFQERALTNKGALALQISAVGNTNSWFDFRFTDFCNFPGKREPFLSIAYHPYHRISFRDCVFHNGTGYAGPAYLISLTNNLFDRCEFSFRQNYYSTYPIGFFYNNLFRGGKLTITEDSSGSSGWQMRDNLFDQSELVYSPAGSSHVSFSNNGFTTNTTNSFGGSNNKTNLTADYVPGPLGDYYYPNTGGSSSLPNLFNTGSRTADLAHLFHFTTTTDQVKEGNSTVDIGYHHVVVTNIAGTWHPIDTDGDGVPDYLEDVNGNGVTDAGETSCLNPLLSIVGTATYTKGGPPRLLDTNATVTDSDSLNLGGGQLRVTLTSGADAGDQLSIRNQGTNVAQIGVSGGVVTYAGVAIATVTGGSGTHSLVVSFNTNATPSAVQALVRNLTFYHPSGHPPDNNRSAAFILTDGDGGTNAPTSLTIQVSCPVVIDAMIVFDVSDSIWDTNFAAAKLAASNFVSLLNLSVDRVGLISFAENAVLDQPLTTNSFAVQTNLAGLARRSGTLIQPALDLARTNLSLSGSNVSRVLVLLSDGETEPENTTTNALQAAARAAEAGIRIMSLSCLGHTGYTYGTNLMHDLASSPHDYYFAPDSSDFQSNFTAAAAALCRGITNLSPRIAIASPDNNVTFAQPLDLLVKATATDPDGEVTRVEFFTNNVSRGSLTHPPFQFAWTSLPAGSYAVHAIAWDNDGLTNRSSTVFFSVAGCSTIGVQSLTLATNRVPGGESVIATVTLSNAAPAGGQVVFLSSPAPAVSLPASLVVPAGTNSARFAVETYPVLSQAAASITAATAAGSAAATLDVGTGPFRLAGHIGQCGPMDVAVLFDISESMDRSLDPVRSDIVNILDTIEIASQGDYRLALVSFDEQVHVNENFAFTNRVAFSNALSRLSIVAGCCYAEPSEEALNTVLNTLSTNNRPMQTGNFSDGFRPTARKTIILITDEAAHAFNGGALTTAQTHARALEAAAKGVRICALVPPSPESGSYQYNSVAARCGEDYARTTDGLFFTVNRALLTDPTDGTPDIQLAIQSALSACGAARGEVVVVRDDLRSAQYDTIQLGSQTSASSAATSAGFDLTGLDGLVTAARLERRGLLRVNHGSHFSLEFGAASPWLSNGVTFSMPTTDTNLGPYGAAYSQSWALPFAFHSDLDSRLGTAYTLQWLDRASTPCGNTYNVLDLPQADWPIAKNVLGFKMLTRFEIAQGRCRNLLMTGTDAPAGGGAWDVVCFGQLIASPCNPKGWSVERAETAFGGFSICVPMDAMIGDSYDVRFSDAHGTGSTRLAVIPASAFNGAPVLKPLVVTPPRLLPDGMGYLTVALDAPAPGSGAYVGLTCSLTNIGVPSFACIPPGETSITVPFQIPSSGSGSFEITASYNGNRTVVAEIWSDGPTLAGTTISVSPGANSIGVSWLADPGALYYHLYRWPADGVTALLAANLTNRCYWDDDVELGTTYCYRVMSVGTGGTLSSFEDCATPTGALFPPAITPPGGRFFDLDFLLDHVRVVITNLNTNATIRYTVNGTEPTNSSDAYSYPLYLDATTTVTAKAFNADGESLGTRADFIVYPTRPYGCGSNETCRLTEISPYSPLRGDHHRTERFRFEGMNGVTVTLWMHSSDFNPCLYLIDPNGQVVAENDDGGFGTDSWIEYTLKSTGTYAIEATTAYPDTEGEFSLLLDCATSPELTVLIDHSEIPNHGTLDFGLPTVGGQSVSRVITITNTGSDSLTLNNPAVVPGSPFTLSAAALPTLPPGAGTNVIVTFNTGATGAFSGVLSFHSNDGNNGDGVEDPFVINLVGYVNPSGTAPMTSITSPASGQTNLVPGTIRIETSNSPAVGEVEFFARRAGSPGRVKIGNGRGPTAFLEWTNATSGACYLSTTVTDSGGRKADSRLASGEHLIQVNTRPVAMPDFYVTLIDSGEDQVNLLRNDIDPDGPSLSILSITAGTNGTTRLSNGKAYYTPSAATASHDYFTYLITDGGLGYATGAVKVAILPVQGDLTGPDAVILSPTNTIEITGTLTLTGTAASEFLQFWDVQYRKRGGRGSAWTTLAEGSESITSGALATFDATTVPSGIYEIRLRAVDFVGNLAEDSITVRVAEGPKVGHFTLSFTDLQLPVSGLPIILTRTYDSREPAPGDFGAGWQLDIGSVRLEKSGIMGEGWGAETTGLGDISGCVVETEPHEVTITFPGDKVFRFAAVAILNGQGTPCTLSDGMSGAEGAITFAPLPGTLGTLRELHPPLNLKMKYIDQETPITFHEQGDNPNELDDFGALYDPAEFEFITVDGRRFQFNAAGKVVRMTDRNGNSLTINADGIIHSSGKSVKFHRDGTGRITEIYDPNGLDTAGQPAGPAALQFQYDGAGNLAAVLRLVDRSASAARPYVTTWFYYEDALHPHHLTRIVDPRGVTGIRNEYGEDGRLKSTTDALGNTTQFLHDLSNRVEIVINRLGAGTTNYYDARGNVTAIVNALGQTNRFAYDANNQVIQTVDALGFTNSFGYDASGKRNAVTNALGQVTRFAFDGYGQLSSKTDALTNTTSFEYSALGSRTAVVDAMGHRTGIAHDAHGRPTAVTNALGQLRAQSGSDANGSLQFVSEVGGLRMDFSYDGNLNTTNTRFGWTNPFTGQARMLATTTEFDAAGRITRVTDPDNQSRHTLYDEGGRVRQSIGRMGETNSYVYDAKGNLIESSFPDGTVTRSVYDANDQMTHTVDRHLPGVEANGSHSIYDVLGRVERTERLAGMQIDIVATGNASASVLTSAGQVVSWSSTVYDAGGRVRFTTNAAGVVTETQYDPAGRQTAVIVAQTNRTDFVYDAAGRLRFTTNPLGHLTQHEYDAKGRKIKTILPDNSYVTNSYDEIGRLFAVRDPMGRTTDMEYDDRGRLKAVVLPQVFNPEGGTNARPRFEYEYDVYGNLTVVRDAKGRETKSTYDAFGQLLSRKLPLQQTNFHIYNALGQLAVAVDFKGQSNRFTYDGLGRVATNLFYAAGASVAARTNTFEYELGGRWQRFIRPEGTNEIDRNIDGAVTNILSAEGRITYEHDAAAGWLKRAFTIHSDVRYEYDGLGRLKTVAVYKRNGTNLPAPEITTNTYTRLGSLENVYFPNGTRTAYEYNRLNQLTNMTQFNSAGQLLARYAYTVASDGQRLAAVETRRESGGTYSSNWRSWSNDALRRLVRETCVSTLTGLSYTNAYVYDLVGNRLWKTNVSGAGTATLGYAYNINDQLVVETSTAGGSFTNWYDANGSLTNRSSATETNRYSYDLEGRLTGATIHRIESGQSLLMTSRYFYNAAGIRVRTETTRSVAGGAWVNETNVFLNDLQNLSGVSQVFEELTGAGAVPTTTYTLGGQVLSQHKAGAVSHLMPDGLGSTRLLTDASGAVTNRFTFDAFGLPLDFTNAVLNPARTKILYAGEQHDAGLSQYYLRARYYSPATARFGVRDVLEGQPRDPLTLHRYAYVQNNPLNLRDPSGNETIASVALATSIAQQLQRMYVRAVARHGYVGSKKATELGQSRDSILDAAAGRDASPETDSAVILVHGVTHKWPGWSQEPDAATGTSFQEKLTLARTRPGMANIAFDPLPHDFYEFNWGGFSIGGIGFIPIKSVHQMALVHLEMTHFLVWMQGYANIDLISHSWGTTLTYDLQNISGIETRHWVTMGSPLKSNTPKPSGNTGNWINMYDLNDRVVHLEMFPPFPDSGGLPLPESLTGPGLTDRQSRVDLQHSYNFRATVNPHWWVHSDYWVDFGVASDLRRRLQ